MDCKFVFGLFGCGSDGTLYLPNGNKIVKLPSDMAFSIHTWLNKNIAYCGLEGTYLFGRKKKTLEEKRETNRKRQKRYYDKHKEEIIKKKMDKYYKDKDNE